MFTHATTELFKGEALAVLEQLQIPKSSFRIKAELGLLAVDAQAVQVAVDCLAEGGAVAIGQRTSGLMKQLMQR